LIYSPTDRFRYGSEKGWEGIRVRVLKGVYPLAASLGVMAAVTAILWRLNLVTDGADRLVYLYLFPVAFIAALFNGRLALLCAAVAIVCADYFLQAPLYDLANDNPLEYGDLVCFALLAVTTIKFIRALTRPATKDLNDRSRYGWR
jgi:K+-sensing histidine kinase KdpD